MKKFIQFSVLAFALLSTVSTFAQGKYFSKTATIAFDAGTSLEDIKANSSTATSVIDAATGATEWSVLMKSFTFKRALMQEHFNENYVESSKYPKATFKGKITNISSVNFAKEGTYPVNVTGKMTLHNVTKDVSTAGTITVKAGKVSVSADFPLTVSDFDITIPSVVGDKINKKAKVSVKANLEKIN